MIDVSRVDRGISSTFSKGNQTKWVVNNKFIKADLFGYEGLSEELCSILCNRIENFDYVKYKADTIEEKVLENTSGNFYSGCICNSMLKSDEELISFSTLFEADDIEYVKWLKSSPYNCIIKIIDYFKTKYNLDVKNYVCNNFALDCITLNEDRHLNNLAVIHNRVSDSFKTASIYDNGASLLSDVTTYLSDVDLSIWVQQVRAKPFSTTFKELSEVVSHIRKELLVIDYYSLLKDLDNYNCLSYYKKYFPRARKIILERLKSTEGVLWRKI